MKISLNWLRDYVDINVDNETLKNKLFSCGFEVEEVINIGNDIENVVSAKILEMNKHANAEKLSVCKVDAGKKGIVQIVTGAKNVKVGDKIALALDGAKLPQGKEIKSGELRGVMSEGMMCGGSELNLTNADYDNAEFDGVLILDSKTEIGLDIKEIIDITDTIFDINVTANRPDCQSVVGIAREVSAVLKTKFRMPSLSYETKKSEILKKVEVENTKLCPRYMANVVENIKLEKSPKWMQKRLKSVGINAINSIVDITNYVLTEIGQPMHAFDFELISGNELNIRNAKQDEKITTFDGKEILLTENILVIADRDKPVAIAGIMGGKFSGINDLTKTIVFESAKFARDNIRKTSKSISIRSDSSARYEKGIDISSPEIGMKRALNLISTLNVGTVTNNSFDEINESKEKKVIEFDSSKINSLLGINVNIQDMKSILDNLEIETKIKGEKLECVIPLFRDDISHYPDIAEEIIRFYGYDNITSTLLKNASATKGKKTTQQKNLDIIKTYLCANSAFEIINYSFTSEKAYDKINKSDEKSSLIKLINPLGEDLSVMRTQLISSMLNSVSLNLSRKNNSGRLFEIGRTYKTEKLPLEKLPKEETVLMFACFGETETFFTAKGVLESVFDKFDVKFTYDKSLEIFMHPTKSASVKLNNEKIGYLGEVHPNILKNFEIDKKIFVFEINLSLIENALNSKFIYKNIPKFQSVERDIAIIINENVTCEEISNCIKSEATSLLENVELFDMYKGGQIEKGYKSMAFKLKLRADNRTLKDVEVEEEMKIILKNLTKIGAKLR